MEIGAELKKRMNTYKKNKTAVSPDDLNGKYKAAFEKLKDELKELTEEYLRKVIFSELPGKVPPEIFEKIQNDISSQNIGRKAGRAVFVYFDFDELALIAREEQKRVNEIYERGRNDKTG